MKFEKCILSFTFYFYLLKNYLDTHILLEKEMLLLKSYHKKYKNL